MVAKSLSLRNARAIGGVWFAAALALYWLTGARGPLCAGPFNLTLDAIEGNFPSLNPCAVLADGWRPYNHARELAAGFNLHPFGRSVPVEPFQPGRGRSPWPS
jgi:hypothetical protein